ncbi:hypothetical protein HanXRQr2_Chr10g0421371 [Helianthus annuus]|uniref:Uncharacterized protein n=1 Tax=Helianthus annuus TaxID=4232 RepID=A0A9K3N301_HELAN|nr:hypothetical protein HanXRQr2_Chr10g0421371 [Helianthus annuus]KAJ0951354.1 hypothetical protein HanPSC8_Chr02g0058991 [Helianthus annuus]
MGNQNNRKRRSKMTKSILTDGSILESIIILHLPSRHINTFRIQPSSVPA